VATVLCCPGRCTGCTDWATLRRGFHHSTRILDLDRKANGHLAERAFGALATLSGIALVSSLPLLTTSSTVIPGIELLLIARADVVCQGINKTHRWRSVAKQFPKSSVMVGRVGMLSSDFVLFVRIAILLVGFRCIAWLVVSVALSYIFAIDEAWVLLVEIHR
jgi:hypothetical protein